MASNESFEKYLFIKEKLRSILPWRWYWRLKRLNEEIFAIFAGNNLISLAKNYKTDKWGDHFYMSVYEKWFYKIRREPIRLLEIGIGGYGSSKSGGNSLRMWKRYFYRGHITGIDIFDKSSLSERRLQLFNGDQSDSFFLKKVSLTAGPFDIIIDDGSHIQSHILSSFQTLFPLLKHGGLYFIEDTKTSYRPEFGGSTREMLKVPSAMNYFIQRIHTVNRKEWLADEISPEIQDEGISSISFYHNLIVVTKGKQ